MEDIINILKQWGYEPSCVIGKGAFSQVYCVKDCTTGSIYACKVSREREMLNRESVLLHRIAHPLFPTYHDFRQCEERAFLFMEYVPGTNLKALIARKGPFSERRTIETAVELAKGLEYLHELNPPVLFRDLKPENIMVREDGRVKLLDLGSAGVFDVGKYVMTGTPGYAAPEQWEVCGNVSFYSDVYGLAKVMYFMMTAENSGDYGSETGRNHISSIKAHRGVKLLLEDCLRRDVRERIPDMRCFLQKLNPYCDGHLAEILKLELSACFRRKGDAEYIFRKNILKG